MKYLVGNEKFICTKKKTCSINFHTLNIVLYLVTQEILKFKMKKLYSEQCQSDRLYAILWVDGGLNLCNLNIGL